MAYEYEIIRSSRRTLSLEISDDLKLIIRAPYRCSMTYIESFVVKHSDWIASHLEKQQRRMETKKILTAEEQKELFNKAKKEIPPLVEKYADIMRLHPTGVKITRAQKRFGSCSSKNSLCFSFRLMQYPQEAIEYVVVHELSHIVYKNHGKEFYALIESILPEYKKREALLKK